MNRPTLATLLTLVCFAAAGPVSAAEEPTVFSGGWFLKTSTDCGVIMPPVFLGREILNGLSLAWSGECVNGLVSGRGTLLGSKDEREAFSFEGTMREGAPEGYGVYRSASGAIATGEFRPGPSFGQMVVTSPHGQHFEGGWGVFGPEGHGAEILPNGDRYDGSWSGGRREGRGVFVWADGSRYEGEWHNHLRTGQGMLVSASGAFYAGQFLEGKRNGRGTYTNAAGVRLEADWVADRVVGPVTVTAPDGRQYQGGWRDGAPDGSGTMMVPGDDRYDGEWRDGVPDGAGTLTRADGSTFSGTWRHGCFKEHGREAAFQVRPTSCATP